MRNHCLVLVCFMAFSSVYTAEDVTASTQFPCSSPALNGVLEIHCWGYTECVKNITIRHVCPAGNVLEKNSLKCVTKGSSNSVCDNDTLCNGRPDAMYADVAHSCTSFFRCSGGAALEGHFYCPATTVFNEAIQGCDFPSNVEPPCGTKPPTTPQVTVIVGRRKRSIQWKEWRRARIEMRKNRKA